MKKIIVFLSVAIFAIAVLAFAAETAKKELSPAQKLMQARAAQLTAMNKALGAGDFKTVAKNADELAAESKMNGDKLPSPLAKDITLAMSVLAKDASAEAAKGDAAGVKTRLEGIKGKCGECHVKIRDKK